MKRQIMCGTYGKGEGNGIYRFFLEEGKLLFFRTTDDRQIHEVFQTGLEITVQEGMAEHPLLSLGGKMWALFPWLGTYAFLALERFLKIRCAVRLGLKGLNSCRPYYMQFTTQVGEQEFYRIVAEEAAKPFDPLELVYPKEVPVFEKYDEYVPEELVRKGFARGVLDLQGMKQRVSGWKKFAGRDEESRAGE